MKQTKLVLSLITLLLGLCVVVKAQRLQYFTLASPDNSNVLFNKTVALRISIIQGNSKAGAVLYSESFTLTSDQRGMLSFTFGTGTVLSGNLSSVDWKSKNIVKIEIDSTAGSNYSLVGYANFSTNVPLLVPNL